MASDTKSSKGMAPLQLALGMAFSLNLIYIIDLIGKFSFSIGSYWSAGFLLSLILFTVVWFTEKKIVSRVLVAYILVNLFIFALDLVSFYFLKSDFFPGLLKKVFSPALADFVIRILSAGK